MTWLPLAHGLLGRGPWAVGRGPSAPNHSRQLTSWQLAGFPDFAFFFKITVDKAARSRSIVLLVSTEDPDS